MLSGGPDIFLYLRFVENESEIYFRFGLTQNLMVATRKLRLSEGKFG